MSDFVLLRCLGRGAVRNAAAKDLAYVGLVVTCCSSGSCFLDTISHNDNLDDQRSRVMRSIQAYT